MVRRDPRPPRAARRSHRQDHPLVEGPTPKPCGGWTCPASLNSLGQALDEAFWVLPGMLSPRPKGSRERRWQCEELTRERLARRANVTSLRRWIANAMGRECRD